MLGRGMVCNPGLALAILDPGRPPLPWEALLPLLHRFWQLVNRQIEPRARAGRIKQWLNYLRRCYPEAERCYASVRTLNDPALVGACLFADLVPPAPVVAELAVPG